MTLKDVQVGQRATVVQLHGQGPVRRRILDMGITRGWRSTSARWHPWATPWS